MSVNKVILLGNLGKDPEVRYLDNNKVVASFTLATSETFINRNGEKQTDTEWHHIEMWDNLAKIAEKYLKKGSQVYIEGKIRTDRWTDKEGIERNGKKIKAVSMTLLGGKPAASEPLHDPTAGAKENPSESDSLTDDLPF